MEAGYMDTMTATASLSKSVFRRANSGHLNSQLYYVSWSLLVRPKINVTATRHGLQGYRDFCSGDYWGLGNRWEKILTFSRCLHELQNSRLYTCLCKLECCGGKNSLVLCLSSWKTFWSYIAHNVNVVTVRVKQMALIVKWHQRVIR